MGNHGSVRPPRDLADLQVALELEAPERKVVEGWRDWYAARNEPGEVIYDDHVDLCIEYLTIDYLDLLTM